MYLVPIIDLITAVLRICICMIYIMTEDLGTEESNQTVVKNDVTTTV